MSKSARIVLCLLIVILAGLATFAAVNEVRSRQREKAYSEARALYQAGRYEAAAEAYVRLRDDGWVKRCGQALTDERAQALLETGKTREALELLKQENPGSALLPECEQAVEEAPLAELRGEAEAALADGRYKSAFDRYETLSDEEGMRTALDALEDAGAYSAAFPRAVRMGDMSRAAGLLDMLSEPGDLVSNQGSLVFGDTLSKLMELDDDAAKAAAQKLAECVVGECQTRISEGERSVPWYALSELCRRAGALWTEEWERLMNSCPEDMPVQNGILRDTGLETGAGDSRGTATITACNKSRRSTMLKLTRLETSDADDINSRSAPTGDCVAVFILPGGEYTFTILAGDYLVSAYVGDNWFGEAEGFGVLANWQGDSVANGGTGNYLEGEYTLTVDDTTGPLGFEKGA